ncbi:hypothetical protein KQX54_014441, partial [Cotesia glomerata]
MADDITTSRTTRSASMCAYDALDVKLPVGVLSVSSDRNLHKKESDKECGTKVFDRKTNSTQRLKRATRSQSAKMSYSNKSSRPINSSRACRKKLNLSLNEEKTEEQDNGKTISASSSDDATSDIEEIDAVGELLDRTLSGITSLSSPSTFWSSSHSQLSINTQLPVINNAFQFLNQSPIDNENLKITQKEKIQILTLLPPDWSVYKVCNIMEATKDIVKVWKSLRERRGILSLPDSKPGRPLSEDVKSK